MVVVRIRLNTILCWAIPNTIHNKLWHTATVIFQENIQRAGEALLVNKETNKQAGKEILKDSISVDDFVNTSILSFASGGLISQMKLPTLFKNNNVEQLRTLNTLSQDYTKFEQNLDNLVQNGSVDSESAEKLKKDVKIFGNNKNKIPTDTKPEVALDLMRGLDEISQLEAKKKTLDASFHENIDEQIKSKREEIKSLYNQSNQNAVQQEASVTEVEQETQPQAEVKAEVGEVNQKILDLEQQRDAEIEALKEKRLYDTKYIEPIREKYNNLILEEKSKGFDLFHTGNEGLSIESVSVDPRVTRQGKKGKYGGFYTYDNIGNIISFLKGNKTSTVYGIKLNDGVEITDYNGSIERLNAEKLQELRDSGVKVIRGKSIVGKTEIIVVDKSAIKSIEKINEATPSENITPDGNIQPRVGEVAEVGGIEEQATENTPTESISPTANIGTSETENEIDYVKKEIEKGILNWSGDIGSPRIDLGISWADIRKGEADIIKGNVNTVPAKRLIEAINKAKKEGGYRYKQGTGGKNMKNKEFVTFEDIQRAANEDSLTDAEINEIMAIQDELATEYDEYFNSLDEQTQNEILENYENQPREISEDTQRRESEINVSDEKETKTEPKQEVEKTVLDRILNQDELKDTFDFLDSFKIDPNDLKATLPFLPEVWNAFIEAVKFSVKAGKTMRNAINEAKKILETQGFDKNEIEKVAIAFQDKVEPRQTEQFVEEITSETNPENKSLEFEKMAFAFPNTGEVGTYLSGETIEKYTNETPENNQEIFRIKLVDSLKHGIDTIQLAIDKFGDNFVEKVLEFTENNNIPLESKALLYISLENELNRQKIAFPENKSLLQKQLNLVRTKRQAFARSNSLALNMNRLQKFAEIGFDVNEITDKMFSPSEKESRKKVEKAIESNVDDINKQQEIEELGEKKIFTEKELEEEIKKAKKEWEESNLGFEIRQSKKQIKKEEALAQIQKIKDKWKKSVNDGTLSVSIPYAKQLAYVTPDIIQLAKVYSQIAGLTTIDIFNAVKQDILEVFKDIKDADIKSILKKEFGVKSKFASEESKRKAYISLLNKRIESLDEQISAGKRKIVERTDKYKNDSEINDLREIRNQKVKELAEIDPLYDERVKLKKSLQSTQKQIEEYERKIEENDFTDTEKKEVNQRLSELRNIRDKKKKDYQNAKKEFEQSLISEEEKTEIEYNQKINKKIKSLNNRIEYLKNNKPEKNKEGAYSVWNQEISKLQNEKKELLNKKTTNKQKTDKELNALKNNIKNTKKAIFDLENNVEKNNVGKSSVFNSELSELKTKLSLLRQRAKEIKSNKNSILGQKNKETKISTIVKQALINKGYFREVNKKQSDGSIEVVKLLDWKKLAGEEGSIENIKNKAESALKEMGYTESQIESMQKALVEEYNNLRASVIEKSLKELESRNKIKPSVNRKTISKELAKLYNYGLFEENSDTYSNLLNSAIGFNEFQQKQFEKLKKYGKALSVLFGYENGKNKDQKFSEMAIKTQASIINHEIKNILSTAAFMEGNKMYKFVSVLRDYAGLSQRSKLLSLKQFFENPLSGFVERKYQQIGEFFDKKENGKLVANRKKLAKHIYNDIAMNGGLFYGEVTSTLVNQTKLEDWLNKQSDSKIYHLFLTNLTGRSYLEAADSMNKALITEKFFHQNLVKLLTSEGSPIGKMSKKEAVDFIAENLTGQNFEEAKVLAGQVIDKVNSDAGQQILPKTDANIFRFANDIVKESLNQGNKMDIDLIEKAYNAAYKSAGFTIGHEANNVISKGAGIWNARVEVALEKAIKEKKWSEATMLTLESILTKNIINPFVGGGTNWLFLTLQKAGMDPISLLSDFAKYRSNKIDLTTEEGIKNLENAMVRSTNLRNTATRNLIGAVVSISMAAAYIASGAGDDIEDWLKENEWARKYFKVVSPTIVTLMIANENGELGKALQDLLNIKSDNFNETLSVMKAIDSEKKSLPGEIGRASMKYFDTPLPWRFIKDVDNVQRGLKGIPEYKSDYRVTGFLNGVYQGGLVDYIGLRPEGDFVPKSKDSEGFSFPQPPKPPKVPTPNY